MNSIVLYLLFSPLSSMMHMTDWLPTLLDAAGPRLQNGGVDNSNIDNSVLSRFHGDLLPLNHVDGVSQWDMIRHGWPSNREEFVYAMNELTGRAAIR